MFSHTIGSALQTLRKHGFVLNRKHKVSINTTVGRGKEGAEVVLRGFASEDACEQEELALDTPLNPLPSHPLFPCQL